MWKEFKIDTSARIQNEQLLLVWLALFYRDGRCSIDVTAENSVLVAQWASKAVKAWPWRGDPTKPDSYQYLNKTRWEAVVSAIIADLEARLIAAGKLRPKQPSQEAIRQ